MGIKHLRKFAIDEILSFLLFFCIMPVQVLESRPHTLFQYLILAAAAVYLFFRNRALRKWDWVQAVALGTCTVIVLSATVNAEAFWQIREGAFFAGAVFLLFVFLKELALAGRLSVFVTAGIAYLTVVLLFNDGLMLLLPESFFGVTKTKIGTMVLGNKFSVAYAHFLLLLLVGLREKRGRLGTVRMLLAVAVCLGVSLYVNCKTAALGCLCFAVLWFLPRKLRGFFANPWVFLGAFLGCAFCVYLFPYIVRWKPVAFVIQDVLNRDLTLTGRLNIYGELPAIFLKRPWLGYGYLNLPVKDALKYYANAQNALLDFAVNYGGVAAVLLTALSCLIFARRREAEPNREKVWLLRCAVYTFLVIGIVEISYATVYFLLLALLNAAVLQPQAISALPEETWIPLETQDQAPPRERAQGLISVIIPVYNVQAYLDRCVASVVGQTNRELEILLVDDGSRDGSGDLCDRWAERDSRIRVIHKANGGLSSARNAGLAEARGEYILFVDSDDWIAVDTAEKLRAAMENTGADLVCYGMLEADETGARVVSWFEEPAVLSREQAMDSLVENKRMSSHVQLKFFRAAMLPEEMFPQGALFEDVRTTHRIFARCSRIAVIPQHLYYYYQRSDSITNTVRLKNRFGWLDALRARYSELGGIKPDYAEILLAQIGEVLALTYVQNVFTAEELAQYRSRRREYDRWLRERQADRAIYRYLSRKNCLLYLAYQLLGENAVWLYRLVKI